MGATVGLRKAVMARQSALPRRAERSLQISRGEGREPADRLPLLLLPLPLFAGGRAGVGAPDRNKLLEFSLTRRFAPTSPASGRAESERTGCGLRCGRSAAAGSR